MEWLTGCPRSGGSGASPKPLRRLKMRNELLELYIIYQAKLLHPLDVPQWTTVFEDTAKRLLTVKPLQCLSKRGRLALIATIVGSRKIRLFAPTVLAVLACDWHHEWASFGLLEDAVRQASLSGLRPECGQGGEDLPRDWSRRLMAKIIEEGVKSTVARSWRALRIEGVARERVEKTGRELRALAARCRASADQERAHHLVSSYLQTHRLGGFVQALVSWSQDQLKAAANPTLFDEAFSFLDTRLVEASRARAGQWRVEARLNRVGAANGPNGDKVGGYSTPLRELEHGRSQWSSAVRGSDTRRLEGGAAERDRVRGGKGCVRRSPESWPVSCEKEGVSDDVDASEGSSSGNRKRRLLGMLRVDEKVFVKKVASGDPASPVMWKAGVLVAIRGDGTYDVRFDDGEVGCMVRRADIFGAEHQDLPEDLLRDGAHSGSVVSRDDPRGSTRRLKKRRLTPLSDNSSSLPSLTAWQPRLAKGSAVSKTITRDASGRTPTVSSENVVNGEKNVSDKALLPVAKRSVNGRIRAVGIIRRFRRRRILREGDEEGATPANTTMAATSAGHPSNENGSLNTRSSTGGADLVDHRSGRNDRLKNPQTSLESVLQAARKWGKVDGTGGTRARGDEDIEARNGASLQPGNSLRLRTNVGSFEWQKGLGGCNGRAEAGSVIAGTSTDSAAAVAADGIARVGRAKEERAKGFEERKEASCRGWSGGLSTYLMNSDSSTGDSFSANENVVGVGKDVPFSRESGTLEEVNGQEGQEGDKTSMPRQPISASATRSDQIGLTSARAQRVYRECPSVGGRGSAPEGELEEREMLTGNDGVESNEKLAMDDHATPRQDNQEFEPDLDAERGGELPGNGPIREVCGAHDEGEHKGQEEWRDGASSANEMKQLVDHDHALPTPVLPKPQLLRFPVRRTRRPLTPKSELLAGETANELLREYGQSPPGGSGTCPDEQHVEATRQRYHEKLGEGCVQEGGSSGGGPTGVPDEPLVEPGQHVGGGGGDEDTVSPEGVLTTPSANRRIATADSGGSADSSAVTHHDSAETPHSPLDERSSRDGEAAAYNEKVDTQVPKRPPNFMRVYGSVGITRVRRSIQSLFGHRPPAL